MASNNLDQSNTFTSDGARYLLHISLYCNSDRTQQIHALNNTDIILFEYSNVANNLCIEATLQYADRYGMIDKYMHKQYAYCNVTFCKFKTENNDQIVSAGTLHKDQSFIHKFFVKSIQIMNRLNNVISYRISLVSCNMLNCLATLTYSNYDKQPESIIDLVKKMLTLNNLQIDTDTFSKVKSGIKLNFITNGNDNTLSTVKYLLTRQYYLQKKDSVPKFIYYNDITNKYCMFDISNIDTIQTAEQILISLFNSQNEFMMTTQPANFGSVSKFSNIDLLNATYDKKVSDYDYQHNVFVDRPIKEKDLLDIYNKHLDIDGYQDRFEKRFSSLLKFESRTTFWNSKMLEDIYQNMMDTLLKNNTLVINTNGNIARQPSSAIMVNVDRQMQFTNTDGADSIDELKNKYKAYEGTWIAVKVHNIINPTADELTYRQNLVLTRNFVPKDTTQRSKLD